MNAWQTQKPCQNALSNLSRSLPLKTASVQFISCQGHPDLGLVRTQLDEAALLRVVKLGALDNDSMCRQIYAPSQGGCCAEHFQ